MYFSMYRSLHSTYSDTHYIVHNTPPQFFIVRDCRKSGFFMGSQPKRGGLSINCLIVNP